MVVVPQGGENVGFARLDVHSNGGGLTQLDVWDGGDRQDMPACRDEVIVAATLDNIRHGSPIDLQIGGKVPAEVSGPDDNQTTTRLMRGVAMRDHTKEGKNEKQSAEVTG